MFLVRVLSVGTLVRGRGTNVQITTNYHPAEVVRAQIVDNNAVIALTRQENK